MVSFIFVDVVSSWVILLMNMKIKFVIIVMKLDMSLKIVKKNFSVVFVNVVYILFVIVIFYGIYFFIFCIFNMVLTNDNLLTLILRLFKKIFTYFVSNFLLMMIFLVWVM